MTLITNPNFIDQIVRALGAENRFDPADMPTLNLFIELELRHLVDAALKYAGKDRRDVLQLADVVEGAREIGHPEFYPEETCPYAWKESREEDRLWSSEQLLEEEMGALEGPMRGPLL